MTALERAELENHHIQTHLLASLPALVRNRLKMTAQSAEKERHHQLSKKQSKQEQEEGQTHIECIPAADDAPRIVQGVVSTVSSL